ncbi:hypothetical protein B0H14DRAFT_2598731 [Mycena olivaceomarginata]|nr:hypothetical protein B0H14DRAFT_2598731 [Mycena olivaceomarginata]
MASPEMQCKVFEPVGSLGNDLVRGFIPKVVRGSELDHDRSLRSRHIRAFLSKFWSEEPQFVLGSKSAFKSVDGICGQACTWENEGNRTKGCKDRALIWGTSSEQYNDRKRAANGIQMVVVTVQVSRASEQAAERESVATEKQGTDTVKDAERGTDLRPEFEQQVQEQRGASTGRIGQAVDRRIALAVIPIEQVEQEELNWSAEYPRPLDIVFERNKIADAQEPKRSIRELLKSARAQKGAAGKGERMWRVEEEH